MSKKSVGTGDKPQPLHLQRQGRAYGSGIDARVYIGGTGSGNRNGNGTGIGSAAQLKSPPIFSLLHKMWKQLKKKRRNSLQDISHFPHPNQSTSTTSAEMNAQNFGRSSSRKASPAPENPTKVLQAQVEIPQRTSSLYNEEHRDPIEHQQESLEIPEREERVEIRDSKPSVLSSQQSMSSPSTGRSRSRAGSVSSYQTNATSLPPLQKTGVLEDGEVLEPLNEDDVDPGSFDLVAATENWSDPSLLLRFTSFLGAQRPGSIPILIYYLDAVKALKAISYSNAIAEALEPIAGISIQRRITGTLPAHLREASEGLAEVFCLTDPSRPDNPIVFASEEFHRTTQYGMSYVLGRNCRFLQGPKTNPFSVRRIREKIESGQEHCETFLNYRRDGSPFMNLLMCAPLCDSRGTIRYFIGAQVDISGLVKECSELESLQRLVTEHELAEEREAERAANPDAMPQELPALPLKDEFQELSEMLNMQELDTVRKWGGRMHKETEENHPDSNFQKGNWHKPRLHIGSISPDVMNPNPLAGRISGKLGGIYENYLLVRPYPSLRVLFASPTLRVPGILQSPFMAKIGGSNRVREELTQALADGRGVTAKVRWVTKDDLEGRPRWIHCTPLIGSNGAIGVWMIVIVDDESLQQNTKRYRVAPAVDPRFGRSIPFTSKADSCAGSIRDFSLVNHGLSDNRAGAGHPPRTPRSPRSFEGDDGSLRSGSPYTLRID
ncbi:hypothetical protein DID88_006603 [Monilinia fructigena]|uniref:PAC domain-containing protein n=1 Tax=Monilinia fructigena TaxID=38457 RepID=A0A395IM80_9HELO|nr:hypothetical protein DID88_006603 [Monilinia fructigena]